MPNTRTNKTTRADRIRKIKAGLQKYYANTPLVLAGTSYKPADLQAFLQSDVDANDASTQARATWLNSVKAAQSTDAATNPVLRAIHAQVQSQYGEAPNADTVLGDFGYAPRRKVTKTVEVKTAAVAKNKATRTARHTMGSKQKAKVHGTVPVTPAPDAQPVVSTSPAPVVTSSPTSESPAGASPTAPANKPAP